MNEIRILKKTAIIIVLSFSIFVSCKQKIDSLEKIAILGLEFMKEINTMNEKKFLSIYLTESEFQELNKKASSNGQEASITYNEVLKYYKSQFIDLKKISDSLSIDWEKAEYISLELNDRSFKDVIGVEVGVNFTDHSNNYFIEFQAYKISGEYKFVEIEHLTKVD